MIKNNEKSAEILKAEEQLAQAKARLAEELEGRYRSCLQLGCDSNEEPLSDDTDSRHGKAAV